MAGSDIDDAIAKQRKEDILRHLVAARAMLQLGFIRNTSPMRERLVELDELIRATQLEFYERFKD